MSINDSPAVKAIEPLVSMWVTLRRAKTYIANFLESASEQYPEIEKITPVITELNTHCPGASQDAYTPVVQGTLEPI